MIGYDILNLHAFDEEISFLICIMIVYKATTNISACEGNFLYIFL